MPAATAFLIASGLASDRSGLIFRPFPAQRPLHHRPRAGTFLAQKERFAADFPDGHPAAFQQRMAGGRDGHQFVLEKHRGFQFLGFQRPFGQAQFNRAFQQRPLDVLGVGDFHLQFNVRKTAVKFRQHCRAGDSRQS